MAAIGLASLVPATALSTAPAFAAGAPKTGGTITAALAGVSANLDPAFTKEYAFTDGPDMSAVYGQLDYENPTTGAIEMSFLKSITSSPDLKTWTLTLHPNLKFSDGTPFNAAAIEYNWQRIQNPATASEWKSFVEGWKFKVLSATKLQVTLPSPNSSFPAEIAEGLPAIGSPTAMKKEGTKEFGLKPVGAGPFKVQSYTPSQSLTTVRNPYFSSFEKGQPYLNGVDFQELADTTQQVNAIKTGQAQVGQTLGLGDLNSMKQTGAVNAIVTTTAGGEDVVLNEKEAPFNNILAREAFSLAVNRKGVANQMLPGSPPVNNLLTPSSPFYNKKFDFPAQNHAKAQQLFNKLAASGHPFQFTYLAVPTDRSQGLADYLQSSLAQYQNAKVNIQTVPLSGYTTAIVTGKFEMTIHDVYPTTLMPSLYNYFDGKGTVNSWGYNDPIENRAFAKILQTKSTDIAALKPLYNIVQTQIAKDYPVYFGSKAIIGFETTKNVSGVKVTEEGENPLWGQMWLNNS